jgi:phosphatidylinositol 4-phosphatase
MRKHLQDQVSRYGRTSLVNLINHKGHEKPIKDAYEKYLAQVDHPEVRYQYFDFHAECSKMRWNRISILVEEMEEDLTRNGYFHIDSASPKPIKLQTGVIRTNCMDNLDRTNVTQAAFARWTLDRQLREAGVLEEDDNIAYYEEVDSIFRISACFTFYLPLF